MDAYLTQSTCPGPGGLVRRVRHAVRIFMVNAPT